MKKNIYLFRRFLAFTADLLIITYSLIVYFFGFNSPLNQYLTYMENKEFDFKFQCLRILMFVIYCTIMEASKIQGTLGKKIFGVKVVDIDKNRISPLKSLIRNLSKIISGIPLFLGFIWFFFSPNHQTWHDKIAKTYVVISKETNREEL